MPPLYQPEWKFVILVNMQAYYITDNQTLINSGNWYCMQEPSDLGEVYHPAADQEQWGEWAPPGVSAREDSVCGASRAESVRERGVWAGTERGKKHNQQVCAIVWKYKCMHESTDEAISFWWIHVRYYWNVFGVFLL